MMRVTIYLVAFLMLVVVIGMWLLKGENFGESDIPASREETISGCKQQLNSLVEIVNHLDLRLETLSPENVHFLDSSLREEAIVSNLNHCESGLVYHSLTGEEEVRGVSKSLGLTLSYLRQLKNMPSEQIYKEYSVLVSDQIDTLKQELDRVPEFVE